MSNRKRKVSTFFAARLKFKYKYSWTSWICKVIKIKRKQHDSESFFVNHATRGTVFAFLSFAFWKKWQPYRFSRFSLDLKPRCSASNVDKNFKLLISETSLDSPVASLLAEYMQNHKIESSLDCHPINL